MPPVRAFPPETLAHIFSSGLEQADLVQVIKSSKQFAEVATPILYTQIVIRSLDQSNRFSQAKKEDRELVKKVSVRGVGNPWKVDDLAEVEAEFESMSLELKSQQAAGIVEEIVRGKLVGDPGKLAALYIQGALEDPAVHVDHDLEAPVFSNLKELSVLGHRGGHEVISKLLKRRLVPKLKRLTVCEVTRISIYLPISTQSSSLFPTLAMTSDGRIAFEMPQLKDDDCFESILKNSEVLQGPAFELLVCPDYDLLDDFPSLLHLAILKHDVPLREPTKYVVVYVSDRTSRTEELDAVFTILENLDDSHQIEYLALPFPPTSLSPAHQAIVDNLETLGMSIHYDGDLCGRIAPPSFFEHVDKKQKQEEEAVQANNETEEK